MPTTIANIRDELVAAIGALTPRSHATVKFGFAPRRGMAPLADFRDWAEENAQAAFRAYDVTWSGWEPASGWDHDLQRRRAPLHLVIAYPHQYGIYGSDDHADLRDTLEQDASQILAAIGVAGAANYPADSSPVTESVEVEVGQDVTFGVLLVTVEYLYDTVP